MTSYVTSPSSSTRFVEREEGDERKPTMRERIAQKLAKTPKIDSQGRDLAPGVPDPSVAPVVPGKA